jgi:hypothetical protein
MVEKKSETKNGTNEACLYLFMNFSNKNSTYLLFAPQNQTKQLLPKF